MKQKLPVIGIILILLGGFAVLCYPLVSSAVNNLKSRAQAEDYTQTVKAMSLEQTEELLAAAKVYNDSLSSTALITDPFDEKSGVKLPADYEGALNLNGAGLIGYIDIPKINVYLPIYHGTSPDVLARYAGHLQNTSLPIGGESTHAVISAHSGFTGETFFDYLTDMEVGDEFYVHVLDRTLKYEVDQVKVVLPTETDDLRIIEGGDYVTLLTCTPYSINTHRLLVRGKRVEYDDTQYVTTGASPLAFRDYLYFLGYKISYRVCGAVIGGLVLVIVLTVVFTRRRSKRLKYEKERSDKDEKE